jgi:pyruvate/2-oxoglutarate dehydrogenase complex dihydrolipoamide acyltransferase (E2) component
MTDSANEDVKDLLSRAFTQEPPLRIDRDEVLQQGRKRLRRKRTFEASGVVAAVLVVAVGASMLTNLADESDQNRMPPAASTTAPEPSSQPMTSPTTTTTTTSGPEAPSVETSEVPPPESQQAIDLTTALRKSGFLAPFVPQSVGGPVDEPTFTARADVYSFEYEADLYVKQTGPAGHLKITVDYAPGKPADCSTIPGTFFDCETKGSVTTARWKSPDGELQNYAVTVHDDGTRVAALSSNMTIAERMAGQTPKAVQPAFDKGALRALVTIPDFSVR